MTSASLTLPAPVLRDLLTGALVCAARDATTPVLECVRLAWDGATVKVDSTDRYRMVEGTYGAAESTEPASILLDRRDVDAVVKFLPKHGPLVTVTVDERGFAVNLAGSVRTVPVATPEREFPKVESLWPTGEPVPTAQIGLDPGRTAGMGKVPLESKTTPWRWTFYGPGKPTLVTAPGPGGIAWRWIIMPVRLGEVR